MTIDVHESWRRLNARTMDREKGLAGMMPGMAAWNHEGWVGTLRPDANVTDNLRNAVWVAAVDFDHPFVRQLLGWCVEYADLAASDPRWETKWSDDYRELRRGNLLQAGALARAWLGDAALDDAVIREAAGLLEDNAIDIGFWAGPEQSQLLAASQLHLIAGDAARARAALARRKRFKHTQKYLDWFAGVLDALDGGDAEIARQAFDEWFDVVRRADWEAPRSGPPGWFVQDNHAVLCLRLALIRRLRIERKPLAGGWRELIASIAGR